MRNTLEGFNQSVLIQLGLKQEDVSFLRWFLSFIASGQEKKLIDNDKIYYWVKYSKVLEDLPFVFKNIHSIRRMIKRISYIKENDPDNTSHKPLIMKLAYSQTKGAQTYFRFDPIILEGLEGSTKMESIVSGRTIEFTSKVNKTRKRCLNKNVRAIINELARLETRKGERLFHNKMPQDDYTYTKSIGNFQSKLLSIYEGRFFCEYPIEPLFERKNSSHNLPLAKEMVRACRGSWSNIQRQIINSARNYSSWFDLSKEPENKDWLPKDFSSWLYSERNKGSLFLASITGKAFPLRELSAEKVFESVPDRVREVMGELKKDEWDGLAFWSRVKSIVRWYLRYYDDLIEEDSNCGYFLDGGLVDWLLVYKKWLMGLVGSEKGIYLSHLGTGNNTWKAFLNWASREYNITTTLPST